MTPRLKKFTIVAIIWSAAFVAFLWHILSIGVDTTTVAATAVVFTSILTSAQNHAQSRDNQRAVRYNLGLRYQLVSLVAASLATGVWAIRAHNPWLFLGTEAGICLIVLGGGYLANRKRIKGNSAGELFQ